MLLVSFTCVVSSFPLTETKKMNSPSELKKKVNMNNANLSLNRLPLSCICMYMRDRLDNCGFFVCFRAKKKNIRHSKNNKPKTACSRCSRPKAIKKP